MKHLEILYKNYSKNFTFQAKIHWNSRDISNLPKFL